MQKYIQPALYERMFTCPHCGAIAGMAWVEYYVNVFNEKFCINSSGKVFEYLLNISTCNACNKFHIWLDNDIIFPLISNVPEANGDMPESVLKLYNEAKNVFPLSAKAAAALLRLAIQLLCKELGETGDNINADIARLVQKGLPVRVQQALDYIRVVGNNAVHPGTIDLDDDADKAGAMFVLINIIVNDMITQPKSIEALYSQLPKGALEAIQRRDIGNT
jgi:hypothetical protein